MKEYRITYREKLVGWYFVEAESEEDARAKFEYMQQEGKIDYSDMELIETSVEAEEA